MDLQGDVVVTPHKLPLARSLPHTVRPFVISSSEYPSGNFVRRSKQYASIAKYDYKVRQGGAGGQGEGGRREQQGGWAGAGAQGSSTTTR